MNQIHISCVCDNVVFDQEYSDGWGYSAVIETPRDIVLFDTGPDGGLLLSNLERLGVDVNSIEAVVISHDHDDHTGGLLDLVESRDGILPVFVPDDFSCCSHPRANISVRTAWSVMVPGVYVTGSMGNEIREQGLVIDTAGGAALLTGCAHPGIATMIKRTTAHFGEPLQLVAGGFHLFKSSQDDLLDEISKVDEFDIRAVVPTHCTGDEGIDEIRTRMPSVFTAGGVGWTHTLEAI